MKFYVRKIVLVWMLLYAHITLAQEFVEVIGHGHLQQTPDFVQLTLGVESQASKASTAARNNANKMAKLVAFLAQQGFVDADMNAQQLQLHAVNDYKSNRISGYRASRSMVVKVRNFGTFDQLLVNLAEQGGNHMRHLAFGLDDANQYQTQLQQQAMTDANHKATVLAVASLRDLGQTLQISEYAPQGPQNVEVMARTMANTEATVIPSLQVPVVDLHYRIKVRYQLN